MRPIIAIIFYADDYNSTKKEVVVFKESYMGPAPKEGEGIWEYFDVHEPLNDIHTYGIDENGFLYALSDSGLYLCSQIECKLDNNWYNREARLKNKP
ncbi:hypothetical protein ACSMDC_09615 [Yersinia enterocolitica]|uniref:hypothetical protein n=1 Tax=Yersinia enterocolitica TaxID=630 RepID=UPI003F5203C4